MRDDVWSYIKEQSVQFSPENGFRFSGDKMSKSERIQARELYNVLETIETACGADVLKRLTYLTGTTQQEVNALKALLEAKYKPFTTMYKFIFENKYEEKYGILNKVITSYKALGHDINKLFSEGYIEESYDFPVSPGLFMVNSKDNYVSIGISGLLIQPLRGRDFIFKEDNEHSFVYAGLRHGLSQEMIEAFHDRRLMVQF